MLENLYNVKMRISNAIDAIDGIAEMLDKSVDDARDQLREDLALKLFFIEKKIEREWMRGAK